MLKKMRDIFTFIFFVVCFCIIIFTILITNHCNGKKNVKKESDIILNSESEKPYKSILLDIENIAKEILHCINVPDIETEINKIIENFKHFSDLPDEKKNTVINLMKNHTYYLNYLKWYDIMNENVPNNQMYKFINNSIVIENYEENNKMCFSRDVLHNLRLEYVKCTGRFLTYTHACFLLEKYNCNFDDIFLFLKEEYQKIIKRFKQDCKEKNKIALCMTGHLRDYYKVAEKNWFLNIHPNIDLFIFTWNDLGFQNSKTITPEKTNFKVSISWLQYYYPHATIKINDIENHEMNSNKEIQYFLLKGQADVKYINSQFYSNWGCFNLIQKKEEYCGFVRIRCDWMFSNEIDVNGIINNCINHPDVLFVNGEDYHKHPGGGKGCQSCSLYEQLHKGPHTNDICDVIAYGSFPIMNIYFDLLHYAPQIAKNNQVKNFENLKNHPEIKFYKENEKIWIENVYFTETLIICYYPERIIREQFSNYKIIGSSCIKGAVSREYHKFFN
jgi:hypothetical protein